MTTHEFLRNLALVMCVAGVTTLVFQRLRQPVVFGYLLAGLIIGPHTMVPLVADEEITHTLAEMGVIMLMFSLGLEFTFRKLIKVGPTAGVIGVFQSSAMVWLGYMAGRLLGWTSVESIYAGAIVAISSTTIIMKAFTEQGVRDRYTRLVFGILIVEDLIAIFLLTLLTAIAAGSGINFSAIANTALNLALFLGALIGIGLLIVPRLTRAVFALERTETILVTSVGICFAFALLAVTFGYSVALGAFIAGSLVAESGHGKAIERLVQPVTDMFGAIFFVAVGMLINPQLIIDNLGAVALLTAVVLIGKVFFVTIGAFAVGQGVRTSVQSGMSLAQIGEFSFIIATLGLTLGAIRGFMYPVAVAVSAITTLATPILIKRSARVASWVDRTLPRTLQTYVALYGSWIERLGSRPRERSSRGTARRRILLLIVDTTLLIGIVIGAALNLETLTLRLAEAANLTSLAARWILIAVATGAAGPLIIGVLRITRVLSHDLAAHAFPEKATGQVDLAAAPRNTMEVTLHLMMVITIGGLLVVITQPFLPLFRGAIVLALVLIVLSAALWRSATNLQGHTRAGAEIIALALSKQMTDEQAEMDADDVQRVQAALPGFGEPIPVTLVPGSRAIGRTLGELDLRGSTGATVLTILKRGGDEVVLPTGSDELNEGDVVFLAGANLAVKAARNLLQSGQLRPEDPRIPARQPGL
jgi:CPA2 family monovalent cation:H+ antiporter-2